MEAVGVNIGTRPALSHTQEVANMIGYRLSERCSYVAFRSFYRHAPFEFSPTHHYLPNARDTIQSIYFKQRCNVVTNGH
jgi:hypothetical protein